MSKLVGSEPNAHPGKDGVTHLDVLVDHPGSGLQADLPVTTDPRYNRRAIASRNVDGLTDLTGGPSMSPTYTTEPG
jgi:hypothetical protein